MNSLFSRAQLLFSYLSTFGSILCILIALTSLHSNNVNGVVDIRSLSVIYGALPQGYSTKVTEYSTIKFDLDADFRSLFDWNTKQVFVYITLDYPGDRYTHNSIVVWDRILTEKDAVLKLRNEKQKYNAHDISGKFMQRSGNATVHWNVQPYVGFLQWGSIESQQTFDFPERRKKK